MKSQREMYIGGELVSSGLIPLGENNELETNDNLEFKDFMSKLNLKMIQDIIGELALRSGVKPEGFNRVNKHDIHDRVLRDNQNGDRYMGEYVPVSNQIFIDYKEVEDRSRKIYNLLQKILAEDQMLPENQRRKISLLDLEDFVQMLMINLICHEQIHASVKVTCEFSKDFDPNFEVILVGLLKDLIRDLVGKRNVVTSRKKIKSGYFQSDLEVTKENNEYSQERKTKDSVLNLLLNEVITEKIAKEIFAKYVRRVGQFDNKKLQTYNENYFASPSELLPYAQPLLLFEQLMEIMAQKIGVDKEIIWRGFVRGAFEGGALEDEDVRQWFAEVFSSTFLDELGQAQSAKDFAIILDKYKNN